MTAALLPSLLAVLAVSALITSIAVWRGQPDAPSQTRATSAGGGSTADPALLRSTASATTSSTPSSPGSSTAALPSSRSAKPSTSSAPAGNPKDLQVSVLNQTRRAGLAGTVAQVLRGQGWTVPVVGNFRGVVSATTVYYPPGAEAAALAAAKDLPVPARTRPRFGNLSGSRLTVVVTDSYPR